MHHGMCLTWSSDKTFRSLRLKRKSDVSAFNTVYCIFTGHTVNWRVCATEIYLCCTFPPTYGVASKDTVHSFCSNWKNAIYSTLVWWAKLRAKCVQYNSANEATIVKIREFCTYIYHENSLYVILYCSILLHRVDLAFGILDPSTCNFGWCFLSSLLQDCQDCLTHKKNSVALVREWNYTDQAKAACRRS
jgi:hypothetical protein